LTAIRLMEHPVDKIADKMASAHHWPGPIRRQGVGRFSEFIIGICIKLNCDLKRRASQHIQSRCLVGLVCRRSKRRFRASIDGFCPLKIFLHGLWLVAHEQLRLRPVI
jgi:hypothetical protein